LFGFLVGIVAIVPAELAMVIWKSRLDSDATITGEQRVAAVAALILAGIFSSLTTSSFFSYSLPQLFPAGYLEIAPTLNIVAIVGSWIVFLMAVVAYSIFSRQTQQNLAQAKAQQGVFDARMSVLRSAGEAIRAEADNWINRMDDYGVFVEDAKRLIANSLNMEEDRVQFADDAQPGSAELAERPALPAPEASEPPGLMDRIKSIIPPGRDAYIVLRLIPGRGRWSHVSPFDSYQDAESHVKSDAGNHAPGTKYRITSHGQDIALFEVDATGHAIEERPARAPVRPPGYGNGRPVQEATAPAGPQSQRRTPPPDPENWIWDEDALGNFWTPINDPRHDIGHQSGWATEDGEAPHPLPGNGRPTPPQRFE
jgi:hypothetical protein